MCGIVGWVNLKEDLREKSRIMEKMTETLANRGPDAEGFYIHQQVLFGHRRLTVVDPEGGTQPMTRKIEDRSYTIVYNGELYNTEDIRKSLIDLGYEFESYSDTEVLLVAYIAWGTDCVKKFNGIFAFGIWDEAERRFFMARDPLAVKPLFYSQRGDDLLFASELKALLAHPMMEPILDETGIMEIFGLGPARSLGSGIFKDIKEIPPAHSLVLNDIGIKINPYWQLESRPHEESLNDTIAHTRELLVDAIERQLVSDVPIATFLSGGLDSSAISAIASNAFKRNGKGKLNTYSIDYEDNELYFNASEFQPNSDKMWVKKMSQFLDSNHHEIILSIPELVESLGEAVKANDLPGMADVDSSLYLFCKAVKDNTTVALSGECADEIFGGYPWFRREEDIQANTFPWSKATEERKVLLGENYSKLPLEDYVASKYEETLKEVPKLEGESLKLHRMREISYLNLKWFMITLLNRKDRMSMRNGLEVRVPFADHRLVEYAWNIPLEMKYCDGREKGLLRRALTGILPQEVIERKKSPYPKTHHPAYLKAVQRKMKMILQNPNSPILNLIDKHQAWDLVNSGGSSFNKPWFGQLMTGPQLLAYMIQINEWMEVYHVKIK